MILLSGVDYCCVAIGNSGKSTSQIRWMLDVVGCWMLDWAGAKGCALLGSIVQYPRTIHDNVPIVRVLFSDDLQ